MRESTERLIAWNETNEEAEQRRKLAQADDTGWMGTLIGLGMSVAALVTIWMN